MRIGIFMGGQSREREVSFAGGRTLYDNLDKSLFTPVPILVDSRGTLIELQWSFLYKGTLRDFYPPQSVLPYLPFPTQLYLEHIEGLTDEDYARAIREVGRRVSWEELPRLIDFAFLALHGAYGEDGSIQGLLQWLGLPYSGSGIFGSAMGMDKVRQRKLLPSLGFASPRCLTFQVANALADPQTTVQRIREVVGFPAVLKHPRQGSSIGVEIVNDSSGFLSAFQRVAFREEVTASAWKATGTSARHSWAARKTDLREGVCLPLWVTAGGEEYFVRQPDHLVKCLDQLAQSEETIYLRTLDAPVEVLVEEFIAGDEFSVIVVALPNGTVLALPPTQIVKAQALFDYRSKYLPGLARKLTPMRLPDDQVREICRQAEMLMQALSFSVYARLDGIRAADGTLYFNDPNTTSGMLPGSFFFHQAAEVGLNPKEFITYIIHASLQARAAEGVAGLHAEALVQQLNLSLSAKQGTVTEGLRVGVLLGGYSTERHVSVESGRNVYEKLSSSPGYLPKPIFVLHNSHLSTQQIAGLNLPAGGPPFTLWELPVALLLMDNADDIAQMIVQLLDRPEPHPVVAELTARATIIRSLVAEKRPRLPRYIPLEELNQMIDFGFIALHGRPGEDGQMQTILTHQGIPYNGSGPSSGALTIDKFATNECLTQGGLSAPMHYRLTLEAWSRDTDSEIQKIEKTLGYPLIAKPVDDGCSSAVKKIRNTEELRAYAAVTFREGNSFPKEPAAALGLKPNEEFPARADLLLETLVGPTSPNERVLEVTVGLLTRRTADGLQYQIFEPSETLATGAVLSLEEKFLAGEGQNITPARFSHLPAENTRISTLVKTEIERAAKLLSIEGYARMDAFVRLGPSGEVKVEFIEVNSLPAMTPATCIFHQSALAGYSPVAYIKAIIEEGLKRGQT